MNDDKVLAEGEATGHAHRATTGRVIRSGGRVTLENAIADTITHEEHKPIVIPPGKYERLIVREYDHAAEEARAVRD